MPDAAPPAHPLPVREAILTRAQTDLADWRSRLPKTGPRLFLNPAGLAALRQTFAAARGLQQTYFNAVLARAAKLAAAKVPEYRTPQEIMTATGMTPLDAKQELWMRPVGNGLVTLATALALRDDPAVRNKLRETVLATCRYPQWGTPGTHADCDLAAGHVARGIAMALDWHPAAFDPADRRTVLAAVTERMNHLAAAAYGTMYWAGKYEENHLHVAMCAIGLCGVAFLDELPDAPEWTALGLDAYEHVAAESSPDGTSPEGVPYWSYGMSYTLQYIEGAHPVLGTRRLYDAPYFKNSNAARLHASTPDLSGIVPWGDAPPRDYYGPHHMLYRLAAHYRDGTGQFLAEHLPFQPGTGETMDDAAWTALWYDPTVSSVPPAALDHHASFAGMIASRSGWTEDDALLCFKAGFTNRNHSHLDAGAIAYCRGRDWLLRTPGYGKGKGESAFWDARGGRWTYFSNTTESHCTLVIDGRNQRFTPDARGTVDTFAVQGDYVRFGADLTGAYDGVTAVRRDVLHRRGKYVLVFDRVTADGDVTAEWLAQTPPEAERADDGLHLRGRLGTLQVRPLVPATTTFAVRPARSAHADVDPKHLKTYALAQTGRTLRFVVALLQDEAVKTVTADAEGVTLTGDGWEDRVTLRDAHRGPPALSITARAGDATRAVRFQAPLEPVP